MKTLLTIFISIFFTLFHAISTSAPLVNKLGEGMYNIFEGGYNSLVIISEDDVLVTDTSNSHRAEILKKEIAKLTSNEVNMIALTHEHYDHVGGTEVFSGAKIFCHSNCMTIFDLDVMGIVPKNVDIAYDNYLKINVGKKIVEMHHFGPADGNAMSVIYLPEEGILHTADLYEPREVTLGAFMEDVNMLGVRKILNTVKDWKINHAVNLHSPATDPQDLYDNIEYFNDLYEVVYEKMNEAIASEAIEGFFEIMLSGEFYNSIELPKYNDWNNYETDFNAHVRRMVQSIFHGG